MLESPAEPMPQSTTQVEADRIARAIRFGPYFSIAGVLIWMLVIAAYFLLGVTQSAPGDPIHPIEPGRFVLTFILLAFGIFWGTTLAGIGFAMGLLERKRAGGSLNRAKLAIGLGVLGVSPMVLVILEIARVSMR